MITFITDMCPGEPDILTPIASGDLVIHDALDGSALLTVKAPASGWTHDLLVEQGTRLKGQFDPERALDARIDGGFVGSTEV